MNKNYEKIYRIDFEACKYGWRQMHGEYKDLDQPDFEMLKPLLPREPYNFFYDKINGEYVEIHYYKVSAKTALRINEILKAKYENDPTHPYDYGMPYPTPKDIY